MTEITSMSAKIQGLAARFLSDAADALPTALAWRSAPRSVPGYGGSRPEPRGPAVRHITT
jgi:hypothetical protein